MMRRKKGGMEKQNEKNGDSEVTEKSTKRWRAEREEMSSFSLY